jgi:sigma-54 dependent transcriptional regulator, acetoin dehydrogenase operon transcriptional activator AcoR
METNALGRIDSLKDLLASTDNSPAWVLSILDSIYDGILVIDESTVVRYINPEYTRITGVARDQIIGRPLREIRPKAMLPDVMRSGVPVAGVFRQEGEIEYVVDMAPIIVDGVIKGGVSVVKDITEVRRLSSELSKFVKRADRLKKIVHFAYRARYIFDDIIGTSESIKKAVHFSRRAALGTSDILISGESGTGKEVFAQAIHNASGRSQGPFVPVSCAMLAPTLVDSELFGYGEGAFTGAKKEGKVGLFEIADSGTIFLDEIGELPMEMQAKLLRTLQERTVRRIGETKEYPVNVRIIAATNRNLKNMVKEMRFREDLYYRLDVMNIYLPPLRERAGDVKLLAEYFLERYCMRIQRHLKFIPEVSEWLINYNWPGNIRELMNTIEYAASMADDNFIYLENLPETIRPKPVLHAVPGGTLADIIRNVERKVIQDRLAFYGSDLESKKKLAAELGISLATLYNKIKSIEILVNESNSNRLEKKENISS